MARIGCLILAFMALLSRSVADDQSQGKEVLVKESVLDSAVVDIVYLGKNHECVLVTTKKKKMYYSQDAGQTWSMVSDKVDTGEVQVERVIVNPADKTVAVLQAMRQAPGESKRYPYIYISENSGKDWRRAWGKKHGLHNWISHPKEKSWALVSWWSGDCDGSAKYSKTAEKEDREPCVHKLMFTKDLGKTFVQLTTYVVQFSWGSEKLGQASRVYFTAFEQKTGDQGRLSLWTKEVDFKYVDIDKRGRPSGNVQDSVRHGNKFLISNEYILVARVKDTSSQTVNLMVSSDGAVTWAAALLPSGMGELEERWYTVLDTSEGSVILHINSDTDGQQDTGRVFVSDAEGVKYSQSLVDNVRSSHGDCEFDKVISLNGIYLANVVVPPNVKSIDMKEGRTEEAEAVESEASSGDEVSRKHRGGKKAKQERTVRTVVSFDKGGAWTYLKPPRVDSLGKPYECDGRAVEDCSLNLHGTTSWDMFAPFYSSESCVGIIMATGNVGSSLRFEPDQVNTFLSRDGGLSWVEAHKGAYIYEFGDHGGLLVMADDMKETTQVVFSWNEGQSWYDFRVGSIPFEVDNIITEPNVTATTFVMFGSRPEGEGVIYFMKFDALNFPTCKGVWAADSVSSDFETWSPSDGINQESCLLGQKVTYTRRKATAQCWNGEQFERPVVKNSCTCTMEDFMCDLGFARNVGSTECTYDPDLLPLSVSSPSCSSAFGSFSVDAYRKVAGDACNGGWMPQKVTVPCPRGRVFRGFNWAQVSGFFAVVGLLYAFTNYMQTPGKKADMFSFGVDRSADKGFITAAKEMVVSVPKLMYDMISGPSRGFENHTNVAYGRVQLDGNDYDLGADASEGLGAFLDEPDTEQATKAFDSADAERKFQREREDVNRAGMRSGGKEVAKAGVPKLSGPASAGAAAAPKDATGSGSFWQHHSIGMSAAPEEDLL